MVVTCAVETALGFGALLIAAVRDCPLHPSYLG
jgi:hypothetical protein